MRSEEELSKLEKLLIELAELNFGETILVGVLRHPELDKVSMSRLALAKIVSWVFIDDIIAHEKMYDNARCERIHSTLQKLAGWGAEKLQQDIKATKALKSQDTEFKVTKPLYFLITSLQKALLRENIAEALFEDARFNEFERYLYDRISTELGLEEAYSASLSGPP
jgi:hypothetical protein